MQALFVLSGNVPIDLRGPWLAWGCSRAPTSLNPPGFNLVFCQASDPGAHGRRGVLGHWAIGHRPWQPVAAPWSELFYRYATT